MKVWPFLLIFALAACGVPNSDEAGPPPADYKDVIKANLPQTPDTKMSKGSYRGNSFNAIIDTANADDAIDPYHMQNVQISAPQPGREQFIPGWRVCLRAQMKIPDKLPNKLNPYKGPDIYADSKTYTAPKTYGYFFVKGSLDSVIPNDAACDNYAYSAWPEMDEIGDAQVNRYLHPKWEYSIDYDYLNQTKIEYATLLSKNYYVLPFPYSGQARAILAIKKDAKGLDLNLGLDRGMIGCKGDGCTMKYRIDDDPIQTANFVHYDSSKKAILGMVDSGPFIDRLRTSHSIVIEVPLGTGTKQYVFSSAGFDPGKIGTQTITSDPFLPLQGAAEKSLVTVGKSAPLE